MKALGMKRSVYGLLDSGMLRRSAGAALSVLLVGSVVSVPGPANTLAPGKQTEQPRMLGKKAVMHVYSYAPKTLEITSVASYFFKDVDACESAVGGALRTATSHASEGDLVDAQCVAIDPPEASLQPEETHRPVELTEL
jgi:hypothetical protein